MIVMVKGVAIRVRSGRTTDNWLPSHNRVSFAVVPNVFYFNLHLCWYRNRVQQDWLQMSAFKWVTELVHAHARLLMSGATEPINLCMIMPRQLTES
jgi:hypothetical protein